MNNKALIFTLGGGLLFIIAIIFMIIGGLSDNSTDYAICGIRGFTCLIFGWIFLLIGGNPKLKKNGK